MSNSVDNNIKAFFQGTVVFTVASVLTKVAQVALLPIITSFITKEQLGTADVIQTLYSFLYPILVLGFDGAFGAYYYDKEGEEYKKKVLNTAFFQLFGASVVALLLVLASGPISYFLFESTTYRPGVQISLLTVVVNLWVLPFATYLRMEKRMKLFSLISLLGSMTLLASNFLLIVVAKLGYLAMVLAIFISYVVQLVLYLVTLRPKLSLAYFDKHLYHRMLRYALPLLPMLVVSWILAVSDRFLLNRMLAPSIAQGEVGLYGVAARFQSILTMVTSVIFTNFASFAFSNRKEDEKGQSFVFVHEVLHVLLLLCAFGASLYVDEIFRLLIDSSYAAAKPSVAPLLFGQVCFASHTIFAYEFAFEKKSYLNLWPTSAGAILNIILNFIYIPRYGATAAAYTTLVGYAVMMCVTFFMTRKGSGIPYDLKKMLLSTAVGLIVILLFQPYGFLVRLGVGVIAISAMIWLYRHSLREGIAFVQRARHGGSNISTGADGV